MVNSQFVINTKTLKLRFHQGNFGGKATLIRGERGADMSW